MSTPATVARRALTDTPSQIHQPSRSVQSANPGSAQQPLVPRSIEPEAGNPELASTSRSITAVLVMPFLFALMLPLVMIGIMHNPAPRHMDLAVIGASPPATQAASRLTAASGSAADVEQIATDAQARDKILHRDIRAAWNPATATVYVATAAGIQSATTATRIFTEAAGTRPLIVHDLAATGGNDPMGSSAVYLGLGAIVGGVFAGLVIAILGNSLPETIQALAMVVSSAAVAGIEVLYGWSIFHLFPGHAGTPWLLLALLGFSATTITWGGTKLIGLYQLALSTVLLTFMGIACSGVSIPLDMAPRFYYWAHKVLPTPRGISALKTHIYLPHASIGWDITVMCLWAAAGLTAGLLSRNLTTNRAAIAARLAGLE